MRQLRGVNNKTMKDLCDELVNEKWIFNQKVYDVMLQVDRKDFAPVNPYQNEPQPINCNVVISAPLLHAYCLEALINHLTPGSTALDIGYGSGYLTVAMAKMMGNNGCVIGIEHMNELCYFGQNNIIKNHKNLLDTKRIELIQGDGRLGLPERAPFKCIHVGAAAQEPPKTLIEQLAPGGRLVMPLGPSGDQYIYAIDKDFNGNINYTKGLSVCYVPLTSVQNQLNNTE